MLITWCSLCQGIAYPVIRTAKGRVRWRCYSCRPGYERADGYGSMPTVEIIEDWVEPEAYRRWHKIQAESEFRLMETGIAKICTREEFFAELRVELPMVTTTPSGGE